MLEINQKALDKVIGSMAGEGVFNVSLFIVSAKHPRLKKLDLDQLSPGERAKKLQKWAEEHRFVAVIEKGDQIFAHTHAAYAEKLQGMYDLSDLSIERKKVTVIALTDEEYDSSFGGVLLQSEEEKKSSQASHDLVQGQVEARQFLEDHKPLLGTQLQRNFVIASMLKVGQIILNCMRQMSEARREIEEQRKEDDKHNAIIQQGIKKDILKREITKGEIEKKELQAGQLAQDVERIDQTRAG